MTDPLDIGAEFLRWEIATAVVGSILHVNSLDEPNVAESKQNTHLHADMQPARTREVTGVR